MFQLLEPPLNPVSLPAHSRSSVRSLMYIVNRLEAIGGSSLRPSYRNLDSSVTVAHALTDPVTSHEIADPLMRLELPVVVGIVHLWYKSTMK